MIAETVFKNIVNERRMVTPGREFGQGSNKPLSLYLSLSLSLYLSLSLSCHLEMDCDTWKRILSMFQQRKDFVLRTMLYVFNPEILSHRIL